jgi:hypothetical protein
MAQVADSIDRDIAAMSTEVLEIETQTLAAQVAAATFASCC